MCRHLLSNESRHRRLLRGISRPTHNPASSENGSVVVDMKGQWIGTYVGSNNGTIIVNVDELQSRFEGVAYLHDSNNGMPSLGAAFSTIDKGRTFSFRTKWITPINPMTNYFGPWDQVRSHFSATLNVPNFADVTGTWTEESLKLTWKTDIGTFGSCDLPKSRAMQPSELTATTLGWDDFKGGVSKLGGRRYLFRGQNQPWRLRTSFHRSGRAELMRYLTEDLQVLHKHLSSRTRHIFNLENASEYGAFLNLAQHHGYPTPLLDWTYSPYVAAFFAFRGITKAEAASAGPDRKVRILIFDQESWKSDWQQVQLVQSPTPHLSIGDFVAIENQRMIPQQAITTVTNIDDIESYIKQRSNNEKVYLWALDIPVNERSRVVNELGYMGITAGSLFPGLDGLCEELKERNFQY